jgi:hypothetical protein
MLTNHPISESYRAPLQSALICSVVVTVLACLMLDGGETARLTAIALAIFWAWVFYGLWQRPRNPTAVDLLLIRCGCLPLVVGFLIAIHSVWRWRGLW